MTHGSSPLARPPSRPRVSPSRQAGWKHTHTHKFVHKYNCIYVVILEMSQCGIKHQENVFYPRHARDKGEAGVFVCSGRGLTAGDFPWY